MAQPDRLPHLIQKARRVRHRVVGGLSCGGRRGDVYVRSLGVNQLAIVQLTGLDFNIDLAENVR
jgi:hypothetical protein